MPALKDEVDAVLIGRLAHVLSGAWQGFPAERFVDEASSGLDELELKDRLRHVATALEAALPDEPAALVTVIEAAIEEPTFTGWMAWPVTELVGRFGPDHPELIVPLFAKLTSRSSCEFAIRGCIEQHPELTFAYLEAWVHDPDEHVRRLVSEGTRPRLPWASRLRGFQDDPTRTLALLDQLRDDPSAYVRRSVANHLGDIVKDDPALAVATAERWKTEGGDHVDEVIRHGLRTLIKAGHPDALRLVGYDADATVRLIELTVAPERLSIGEQATIRVELAAEGGTSVPVVVEYLIHYLGARGPRKPKAYRLAERILEPGVVTALQRRQTFAHASIRTLHPGEQVIEVQVNGRVLGATRIDLSG